MRLSDTAFFSDLNPFLIDRIDNLIDKILARLWTGLSNNKHQGRARLAHSPRTVSF